MRRQLLALAGVFSLIIGMAAPASAAIPVENCKSDTKYANDDFNKVNVKLCFRLLDGRRTIRFQVDCWYKWGGVWYGDNDKCDGKGEFLVVVEYEHQAKFFATETKDFYHNATNTVEGISSQYTCDASRDRLKKVTAYAGVTWHQYWDGRHNAAFDHTLVSGGC